MRHNGRLQRVLLVIVLLVVASPVVSAQLRIRSSVLGSGATAAAGGGFAIAGTVGQPAIGPVSAPGSTTALQGFWYTMPRPASSVETIVAGAAGDRIVLEQNVPNPFSDATMLRVHLPRAGYVRLTLHDNLGRAVQTLVDGDRGAGILVITIAGDELPSGQYTAQLLTGAVRRSVVMTVVK